MSEREDTQILDFLHGRFGRLDDRLDRIDNKLDGCAALRGRRPTLPRRPPND